MSTAAVTPAVRQRTLATGVTLEYVEHGPADGVPVVFLHGVTDSWRSFEPLLPHLPATLRAFVLTQRGHGGSSRPGDGYTYRDFAADVAAFLDAVGVHRAVIAGHSMGGLVATRFALDAPERTRALVLVGTFATLQGHQGVQEMWDSTLATLTDPVDPALAREFQESTLAQPIAAAQLDTFVGESLRVPARVWQAAFRGFLDHDHSAELDRIAVPTLVVWGDRDAFVDRAACDRLVSAIPHAAILDYIGHGHAVHWEAPARVAGDVARFVQQLPAERARNEQVRE